MIRTDKTLNCKKEATRLAKTVCPLTGVTVKQIFSRSRHDEVALTRQILMMRMTNRGWSLSAVGRSFERDHGTVIHARKAVMDRYKRATRATKVINMLANNGIIVLEDGQGT